MIFRPTAIAGVVEIEVERFEDERGLFARTWCREELAAAGLESGVDQCSVSYNHRRHTLRGLHMQAAPHEETKIVRCTRGAIWDVAVDLRPDSETFRQWHGVELSAGGHRQLVVPRGCLHGFLTLEDDTEVFYMIATPYSPEHQVGYRWDDPGFAIEWPASPAVISQRDRELPLFGA